MAFAAAGQAGFSSGAALGGSPFAGILDGLTKGQKLALLGEQTKTLAMRSEMMEKFLSGGFGKKKTGEPSDGSPTTGTSGATGAATSPYVEQRAPEIGRRRGSWVDKASGHDPSAADVVGQSLDDLTHARIQNEEILVEQERLDAMYELIGLEALTEVYGDDKVKTLTEMGESETREAWDALVAQDSQFQASVLNMGTKALAKAEEGGFWSSVGDAFSPLAGAGDSAMPFLEGMGNDIIWSTGYGNLWGGDSGRRWLENQTGGRDALFDQAGNLVDHMSRLGRPYRNKLAELAGPYRNKLAELAESAEPFREQARSYRQDRLDEYGRGLSRINKYRSLFPGDPLEPLVGGSGGPTSLGGLAMLSPEEQALQKLTQSGFMDPAGSDAYSSLMGNPPQALPLPWSRAPAAFEGLPRSLLESLQASQLDGTLGLIDRLTRKTNGRR